MTTVTNAQISAYNTLSQFRDFALRAEDGDKIAVYKGGRVEQSETDQVKSVSNLWRAPGRDETLNNTTRTEFGAAVMSLFGATSLEDECIPEEVRDVLMAGDYDNKGKPLSARRITLVMDAISQTDAFADVQEKIILDEVDKLLENAKDENAPLGKDFSDNIFRDMKGLGRELNKLVDHLIGAPECHGDALKMVLSGTFRKLAKFNMDGAANSASSFEVQFEKDKNEAKESYYQSNYEPVPEKPFKLSCADGAIKREVDQVIDKVYGALEKISDRIMLHKAAVESAKYQDGESTKEWISRFEKDVKEMKKGQPGMRMSDAIRMIQERPILAEVDKLLDAAQDETVLLGGFTDNIFKDEPGLGHELNKLVDRIVGVPKRNAGPIKKTIADAFAKLAHMKKGDFGGMFAQMKTQRNTDIEAAKEDFCQANYGRSNSSDSGTPKEIVREVGKIVIAVFATMDNIAKRIQLRQAACHFAPYFENGTEAQKIRTMESDMRRVLDAANDGYVEAALQTVLQPIRNRLLGMNETQARQYDEFYSLAFGGTDQNRADNAKVSAPSDASIAILCRFALDGKPIPMDACASFQSGDVNSANGAATDLLLELSKGHEKTAVQLLRFGSPDIIRYVMADPERRAAVDPDGKGVTRQSLYAALFPESKFPEELMALDDSAFGSKVMRLLQKTMYAYVNTKTLGKFDADIVTYISAVPPGSWGAIFDIDTAISLYDPPPDGTHLTISDIKGAGPLQTVAAAESKGRDGLIELLALDLKRCNSVIRFGDEVFDFGNVRKIGDETEKGKAALEMAERLLAAVERFCGGDEAQAQILCWGMTQVGSALERLLRMPELEHTSADITLEKEPQTGAVIFKKTDMLPEDSPRNLSYAYRVNKNGSSAMTAFNFDLKAEKNEGTLNLDAFKKIASDESIPDNQVVYLANGEKTALCPDMPGKCPEGFVPPNDPRNGGSYIRRELLLVARDALGGTESEKFKAIQEMLYGSMMGGLYLSTSKIGNVDRALIRKVLEMLGEDLQPSAQGQGDGIMTFARPKSGEQSLQAQLGLPDDFKLFDSVEEMQKTVWSKLTDQNATAEKTFTGILQNRLSGVANTSNVPDITLKDLPRMTSVEFSDGQRLSALTDKKMDGVEYTDVDGILNKLAREVTKRDEVTFKQLEGRDLKLAQFILSHTSQSFITAAETYIMTARLEKNLALAGRQDAFIYTHKFNADGSLSFSAVSKKALNMASSMKSGVAVMCDPSKSKDDITLEYTFTKERLEKILDEDWSTKASQPHLLLPDEFKINNTTTLSAK